jgi:type VI secretion system secreted protein VgrG
MQNWAGSGWGGQVIPRIGMEVMVTYLDGDPDRPVVTGVVPNARQKVPYELPEHKTRSTFKTRTHKGFGFNELRIEDKTNLEEIFVHAQRDMNTVIENDETRAVREDRITRIGGNERTQIEGFNQTEVIKSKELRVGGDYTVTIGGPLKL